MNFTRLLLKAAIAFLCLTAGIAILSVLSGDFGELQVKVLATTLTLSAASITSMACAAFIERRKAGLPGVIGVLFSVAAAAMVVYAIWLEQDGATYWKATLSLIVLAVSSAHAFLLLIPRLSDGLLWTQASATFFITALAAMILFAVWQEVDQEGFYRVMIVISILVVLTTLTIPILARMGRADTTNQPDAQATVEPLAIATLQLTLQPDGTYRDVDGQSYDVRKR